MTPNIKHHLTEELLLGYSTGSLPEAVNIAVATHISMCDECRAAAEAYDSVGGAVLDQAETVSVSESCFASVMESIRTAPATDRRLARRPADPVLPAPLRDYVGGSLDKVNWRPAGMGVRQAILPTSGEATARLLYIPAGTAVPDHSHGGMELTLVLQGAFRDEDGHFGRGDIEVADSEVEHTPIADIGEDCICLAVTDAPLRFKGLLPRLAQPFLRI
ncbi:ChrR family anti-sigma-E factor [Pseudoponticoccus marisrubri]|uniref:Transcriptional regulator n=1 Tax=Pseudoponticoccus marisrubri TaxID=1685382 RepID=A0A0W7WHL5_9RHOB|nr:ChrR family anti-sigma-E factor [Pseudoponticoccus marisrubri]KUF10115.1 transcriptional regulator [Pseudoponticoccus marisrubri]